MRDPLNKPPLALLLLLVSFASVLAVLFTPGLPYIAKDLGISSSEAQSTISVFLIGYAVGTLPYGPLSNRFGRKIAIYIGCSIAMAACLLAVVAAKFSLFWLLIISRFFMAFGSSVGLKIAFTLVGDVYKNEEATKKISALILSFAVMPGLAIALGGFLTDKFGWVSCFYFLAGYCLLILIFSAFLKETTKEYDLKALNLRKIGQGYLNMLKSPRLVIAGLLMGCGASIIYLFAAMAPFIGIEQIGLSPEKYGLLNFIPPVGMILGAFLSQYLAGKKEQIQIMKMGIVIAAIFSGLMLMLFSMHWINPLSLFLPMPFILVGTSIVYSNASSLAMTHTSDKSNASAVMHFLNLGLCVVTLLSVETFSHHQALILPLVFLILVVFMIGLLSLLIKQLRLA